jgi:exosome complex component RRP4
MREFRKYVLPGDVIVENNPHVKPSMNVVKIDDRIHATRVGIAEVSQNTVKVIPLSGIYIPRVGDFVIGKIIDYSSLAWTVDINSCFMGYLLAQEVFGREFTPSRDELTSKFNLGDVVACRIVNFDRTRDPLLTVADKDLGKIGDGELVRISPTRVPRLIGKRGSMIQMIEQLTRCKVIVGQNGVIVVSGDRDARSIAVKAIMLIDEEMHTGNITQRVKELLGGAYQ